MPRRSLIAVTMALWCLPLLPRDNAALVEIIAHDFLAPPSANPLLLLTLKNGWNRPVSGVLEAQVDGLRLELPKRQIQLGAGQVTAISFRVLGGSNHQSNLYSLHAVFHTRKGGPVKHAETLRANVIAHRTITVDGNFEDWTGVTPQSILGGYPQNDLPEETWVPYRWFRDNSPPGIAVAFLAYDEEYFYFAAKIVDRTPDAGMPRFGESGPTSGQSVALASGMGRDNVVFAFPIPSARQSEYALNPVAEAFGGHTEVWRLQRPSREGGPVAGALLIVRLEENSRLVEASLPWTELVEVKKRLDRGEPFRFNFRINHNEGAALELAEGRSVSRTDGLEFAFEK